MQEAEQPNVLHPDSTQGQVHYFLNEEPGTEHGHYDCYVVVDGVRHELKELNQADWIILVALFPSGPTKLS